MHWPIKRGIQAILFELLQTSDTYFAVKVSRYSHYISFLKVTTVYWEAAEGTQQLRCIAVLFIQMQGLTLSTPTSETISSSQVLSEFSSSFHGKPDLLLVPVVTEL